MPQIQLQIIIFPATNTNPNSNLPCYKYKFKSYKPQIQIYILHETNTKQIQISFYKYTYQNQIEKFQSGELKDFKWGRNFFILVAAPQFCQSLKFFKPNLTPNYTIMISHMGLISWSALT